MQVIVDGLLVNYQRQGKGRQLVLLHGWANSLTDLSDLFKNLAKEFDVTAIDLPGFGASQNPITDWGLSDYASFLAKFCRKLNLQPYALVGHSNGGAIAIKAVTSDQIKTEKLVLISSSGIRGDQKTRLSLIKVVTKTAKIASSPLPKSTRNKLRHRLYKTVGSDLMTDEHLSASFKKIVSEDLRDEARKIKQPTLLIYGEDDDQTPLTYGRIYHKLIKNSTLEIITGAGHYIQKDHAPEVVKLMREFLC